MGIAIQAAHERQQAWLDLAPLGFCYLIDFENMTQINGQTQRCRRIQRRSDLAYPLVSGPLPKSQHAWGPLSAPGQGGLLGVDVSGTPMGIRMSGGGGGSGVGGGGGGTGNGSAYPSGALPASAITSLGQPCACQQCMLVLSVKAGAVSAAQTLGRRPPQTKPPSPKFSSHQIPGGSYSLTLPRPPSLSRSFSPHRTSVVGATGGFGVGAVDPGGMGGGSGVASATLGFGGGFNSSLSFLNSATAALSISSTRPPPPPLPPPPPPPTAAAAAQPLASSSLSACPATSAAPAPGLPLISTASSTCTPSPSARVLGPVSSSGASTCAAPLPPRSSLAGLSRPALQRIAMAQSRALIASG